MAAWDRKKGETDKAFAAFCAFRDMPPSERNVADAYRAWKSKPKAKQASGYFRQWSIKWNWYERTSAFDDERDRITRERIIKEAADAKVRRIKGAQQMQLMALQAMRNANLAEIDEDGARRIIKPLREMFDSGVKIERVEYGEASDITENQIELSGSVSQLTDAELDEKIQKKLAELETKKA